jgi:hypothetical protein
VTQDRNEQTEIREAIYLMEMPRGNTFGFVALCSYGAFWRTFALFDEFLAATAARCFLSAPSLRMPLASLPITASAGSPENRRSPQYVAANAPLPDPLLEQPASFA